MTNNNKALATRQPTNLPQTIGDILLDEGRALDALKARFPSDCKDPDAARQVLAICLSYDLDPFQGELVPIQGRPYITEAGWLKLVQKHAPGELTQLEDRMLTDEEKAQYGLGSGDYMAQATVTRTYRNGDQVSATRRGVVRASETKGQGYRPVESEPWEMAMKRARVRALRTVFRDVLQIVPPQFPLGDREDAFEGEAVEARDVTPEPAEVIEHNAKLAVTDARRAFHARAKDYGLLTQRAVHDAMGLQAQCKSRPHDTPGDKSKDCHALRELVAAWEKSGDTEDQAWERARIKLENNVEKREALGPDAPEQEPLPME